MLSKHIIKAYAAKSMGDERILISAEYMHKFAMHAEALHIAVVALQEFQNLPSLGKSAYQALVAIESLVGDAGDKSEF